MQRPAVHRARACSKLKRRLIALTLGRLGAGVGDSPSLRGCGSWPPEEILTAPQVILRTQGYALVSALYYLALVLLAPDKLHACGPWLPEEILTSKQVILRTPVGDFAQEVVALTPADGAPSVPDGLVRLPFQGVHEIDEHSEAPVDTSLQKELAELRSALDQQGTPAERRDKLLGAYQEFRVGMGKKPTGDHDDPDPARFDERARQIHRLPAPPAAANPGLPPILTEGLPGEWVDYLAGAAAFWNNDLSGAQTAWERLLARPQNERLYCSTWAAYMLARISDAPEAPAEERAARYQHVRDLRAAGCRDLFNLASASLGWEARLALDRRDCSTAIRLYYLQAITSGENLGIVAGSFRAVVLAVLPAVGPDPSDPARLEAAARDPFLRRVITLYLACHRFFGENETETVGDVVGPAPDVAATPATKPAVPSAQESWFAALTRAAVDTVPEAAPLAWAAYQAGDYVQTGAWLTKAPAEDGLALWLRAKLALRDGKTDAAAGFFAQAVHAYPVEIRDVSNCLDSATQLAVDARAFRANQFQADLGVISLSRGDYAQALTALLRSGFWRDAAYVAERVMTVDELLGYVKANFSHPPATVTLNKKEAPPEPDETPAPTPSALQAIQDLLTVDHSANPAAYATRYLLARRLSRAGRYSAAREFYPEALLPKFDEYAAAREIGDLARQPAAKRADALWRAARIERWLGMELFGSEDDPDWFVEDGVYDEDDHYRESRLKLPAADDCDPRPDAPPGEPTPTPGPIFIPQISEEEKRRVVASPVVPEKRFHYRFLAADLAWKAAELMPNQQEQTALVLAAGSRWLTSVNDDKGADRFYLAILRRCGKTATGREARRLGAAPPLSDEAF